MASLSVTSIDVTYARLQPVVLIDCTKRYFVQFGEATLAFADLSYIQANIEDSTVVCTTRQAAIYGCVRDRYGAHAHERHHAISSYIRSDIRIERTGGAFKGIF